MLFRLKASPQTKNDSDSGRFSMISRGSIITIALLAFAMHSNAQEVNFNRQIRPILSKHCLACHGPDPEQREADLRLDQRDDALAVIEPGDTEASELVARIIADDDERMPPAEHGNALTKTEIELIRKWVVQGAPYEKHWSFVPPVKPSLPKLNDWEKNWVRNEIDHFVAAKLAQLQLQPSSEADPPRLIRRVALDLTGLPPSAEMVERFVKRPTNETYGQIVDELLASPSYGEHWTAMWLDLARYADTIGYASDTNRIIWPWRDWVIKAFNSNMPYDEFTIEQIAGDLLPGATIDQKLATAFHRNTLNNSEGGTSDEEFRTIAVKDRISTTVNVWMGLTLRCAECHTHKYDPISQTEYYQFLDFFNQTLDEDKNDERPVLDVYPDGREDEFTRMDSEIAKLKKQLADAKPVWSTLTPTQAESRDGANLKIQSDSSIVSTGENPKHDEYAVTFQLPPGTHTGIRLEVLISPEHNGKLGRGPDGSFVLSQVRSTLETAKTTKIVKYSQAAADFSQPKYDIQLIIRDTIDDKGWAVSHPKDGFHTNRTAVLSFETPIELTEPSEFKCYLTFESPWEQRTIGLFRLSTTAVESPAEKYKKNQLEPLRSRLETAIKNRKAPVRVPVMEERDPEQARKTHVMTRGSYLQPADLVNAAVFDAFQPLPENAQRNRLGVAQWLVADDNALTARVTVNRFWARIFGRGIVETEEDFGTQGTPPSNQELLDWIAVDFRENGWNVKQLLKQIVTSSTYRQTSVATAGRINVDPDNVFLSRGPRFRLRAEVIRDQALAVSGLLSPKKFGPPVYPPNPVKSVRSAFAGNTVWVESQGENRYRRAIYTYLKRSSPHPLFETFDMSTREVCNLRRIRTNTPLQSFMTLNDRTFIEAAQSLAAKMHLHSGPAESQIKHGLELALLRPGNSEQVAALTRLYTEMQASYVANPANADQLIDAIRNFGIDEETEKSKSAELAALTVVANVILNLDAFLTK